MVIHCCSLRCRGLSSRSSNSNAYRGQTGNWGQGKWTGLRGEVYYSASQWLLHFWNLRLQSPPSSTPNLIVYLLALAMDCAFFKDTVQASAGGPDRTRLRPRRGPWALVCNLPIWSNCTFHCFLYRSLPFLPLCLCLSCSLGLECPLPPPGVQTLSSLLSPAHRPPPP